MLIKALLLCSCVIAAHLCLAQQPADNTRMKVSALTGFWITHTGDTIEFKRDNAILEIYPMVHANPYMFMIDTANTVSNVGVAANWPPYDCKLHLIDSVSLSITYASVFHPGVTVLYKRKH